MQEAAAAMAAAMDAKNWGKVRCLFAEDAHTRYRGASAIGAEQSVALLRAHLGECGFTQHLMGNWREKTPNVLECQGRVFYASKDKGNRRSYEVFCDVEIEIKRSANEQSTNLIRRLEMRILHERGNFESLFLQAPRNSQKQNETDSDENLPNLNELFDSIGDLEKLVEKMKKESKL